MLYVLLLSVYLHGPCRFWLLARNTRGAERVATKTQEVIKLHALHASHGPTSMSMLDREFSKHHKYQVRSGVEVGPDGRRLTDDSADYRENVAPSRALPCVCSKYVLTTSANHAPDRWVPLSVEGPRSCGREGCKGKDMRNILV